MRTEIDKLQGLKFFETEVEKDRVKLLIEFAEKLTSEDFIGLLPNMAKTLSSSSNIVSFFLFSNSVIFEFRNFLREVNFDYAKYDLINNIRVEIKNVSSTGEFIAESSMRLEFFHLPENNDFRSELVVFGKEACVYVLEFAEKLGSKLRHS
jgi:hypothetical protein